MAPFFIYCTFENTFPIFRVPHLYFRPQLASRDHVIMTRGKQATIQRAHWRLLWLAVFLLLCRSQCSFGVAKPAKHNRLRLLREQAGLQQGFKVDINERPLSQTGKILLSKLTEAGTKGDWQRLRSLKLARARGLFEHMFKQHAELLPDPASSTEAATPSLLESTLGCRV